MTAPLKIKIECK